jgi:predicted porin
MRRCLPLLLVLALAPAAGADIVILKGEENTFSFYGFAKADAAYQDHIMNNTVAARYPKPDTPEFDDDSVNFTAMNSRFGFKWSGPALASGTRVSGGFEFDLFDPTTRNQMKFRTRLAFLELKGAKYSLIAGQHWDLFGAGLPRSLITNGFYWETGNTGFRRAQLRYTRSFGDAHELAVMVGDPSTDSAIYNNMPVFEARYAFKWGPGRKSVLGVYGAWCEEEVEGQTVPLEGIGADLTLPLTPSLTLLTEVSRGSNLKIFLGRSAYYKDAAGAYRDQESTAGWLELYYAGKALDLYAGYSAELFDDPVPAGTLGDSDALFAGIIHKLGKGVSYGLELTRFTGDYEGMDKAAAHQVTASVTYTF